MVLQTDRHTHTHTHTHAHTYAHTRTHNQNKNKQKKKKMKKLKKEKKEKEKDSSSSNSNISSGPHWLLIVHTNRRVHHSPAAHTSVWPGNCIALAEQPKYAITITNVSVTVIFCNANSCNVVSKIACADISRSNKRTI